MNYWQLALVNFKYNKGRTFLTILGLVIGISAVIIIISSAQALQDFVLREMEIFGADTIEVEIKVPNVSKTSPANSMGMVMGVNVTTLRQEDAEAIQKQPNISDLYSGLMGQDQVSYLNENIKAFLFGVSYTYLNVDQTEISEGEFFSEEQEENQAKVVVLGSEIKEKFFPAEKAIGKFIKIGGNKFKVIGVMAPRGSVFFINMDKFIYLPLKTLQKQILGVDYVTFILAKMKDPSLDKITALELTELMRKRHNITSPNQDDFAVTTMSEAQEMFNSVIDALAIFLVAIAGISLVVGGVGIMNVMYVNVNERTYEIGLRKALGATSQDIRNQFLIEAVMITSLGGFFGIIFGLIGVFVISQAANFYGFSWSYRFSPGAIFLATFFSLIVGLIFGLFPALRASRLDPIEALRR